MSAGIRSRMPARGRTSAGRLMHLARMAAAALILTTLSSAGSDVDAWESPVIGDLRSPCGYCHPDLKLPFRRFAEADIDSIGRDLSRRNHQAFVRADSLYRAGHFGPMGHRDSRRLARAHFQLRAETALDYIRRLSSQQDSVFVADEHAMQGPFGELYSNTAVYPLRFLSRALVGPGGFCMEYSIPHKHRDTVLQGGVPVALRDDVVRTPGGGRAHVLALELRSDLHSTINLLYKERFCGLVHTETVVDHGDTLDLLIIDQIEGLYVQRAGVHRMQAILSWRSRVEGDRLPGNPRIGSYVYMPGIRIDLPLFLPSLGLHDLRIFSLPQPVMRIDGIAQWIEHDPEWIEVSPGFGFTPWEPHGAIPDVITERYPDL